MLDDELERERLDVWFAVMVALTTFNELSRLDDEFDSVKLEV
jgi:hypothetical protein